MLMTVKVVMRRMVIGVTTEKDGSTDSLTHCRVRH